MFLLIIIVGFPVFYFANGHEEVPTSLSGCYSAENAPPFKIAGSTLSLDQNGVRKFHGTYGRDNIGSYIVTNNNILPVFSKGRFYFVVDGKVGHLLRPVNNDGSQIEVAAKDGTVLKYKKRIC